MIIIIKQA